MHSTDTYYNTTQSFSQFGKPVEFSRWTKWLWVRIPWHSLALIKPCFDTTKKSRQELKHEKSCWDEIKGILHHFKRALIEANRTFFFWRWESDFKVNESRYLALFVVCRSIKKLFSIVFVNIYFSQPFFNSFWQYLQYCNT